MKRSCSTPVTKNLVNAICRDDFYSFIRAVFPLVSTVDSSCQLAYRGDGACSQPSPVGKANPAHYQRPASLFEVDLRDGGLSGLPARS